jgi:Fur family transcriptional regulator, peroxide stress response regulator
MIEAGRKIDIKCTPQRIAILEYLEGNKSHPSAADVYANVSQKFPTMSFATVYNTLETLREKGVVVELSIDPDKKRFDPNISPHHHLMCLQCKIIKDISEQFFLVLPEEEQCDFHIIGNRINFYGLCPQCKGVQE